MALVAHTNLPSFEKLRQQGQNVLTLERARAQDIRELHVGLLNMMPDAALMVTEQQYMRLVGSCNQIVQFYVHPFSVPGLPRSSETQAYIDEYYARFDDLREAGLDALIITGANVTEPSIESEPFWGPLQEVIAWASEHVTSILCSCLASHALVKFQYQIDRHGLPNKQWGVYSHRVRERSHPLLQNINTRFDVPHSRWNEVTHDELAAAGLRILVESDEADVHLFVSPDQFRIVYMQGHPEYDYNSLLKEYKREVRRFLNREIDAPPPYPEHYFPEKAVHLAESYLRHAQAAQGLGEPIPDFPEADFESLLDNTWGDTGKALFNNWLGLVYQLTNVDRRIPFASGIDPADPLGLRAR
jgi:homoserine O-succinyltransferase